MLARATQIPLQLSSTPVRSRSNSRYNPSSPLLLPHSTSPGSAPLRFRSPLFLPKTKITATSTVPMAGNLTELSDESDFDSLLSPDGYLSICGFGSLLSEKSARSTFPDLENFRVGVVRGFRRVFAHVAPIFFERGIAKEETGEVSSLSVEPYEGETLIVTVFEIRRSEVPSFIERENEFRFLAVVPESLDGTPFASPAVICARYSDDEFFRIRCKGSTEIFFQRYGRYNINKIWRDDILPCRVYLRHCVLAGKNLGETAYNNFLDHTFLGDRKTTPQKKKERETRNRASNQAMESLSSEFLAKRRTTTTTTKKKKKSQKEPWPKKKGAGAGVALEGYVEPTDHGSSSGSDSSSSSGDQLVGRTKSLTEDDLEELKGCLDLGFGFSYDEIPELCTTLPALELCYSMTQRFLLDDHQSSPPEYSTAADHAPAPPVPNWKFSSPGDDPEEVKARLKYWAQTVACTVRLCS